MIAAINRNQKVVWGMGETQAAAIADAQYEFSQQSELIKKRGLGKLECVRMKRNTPIDDPTESGRSLFRFCILDDKPDAEPQPNQLELF